MISYAKLPASVQEKILTYFETNNFSAAKELRDYIEITVECAGHEEDIAMKTEKP